MNLLIKLLADGKFHSGEELGLALQISRSAIWKRLRKLETFTHLDIQKVKGKGYRLTTPLSLLDSKQLKLTFQHWPIKVLNNVDSTNTECFRLLANNLTAPFAVTAEQQSNGKGRRGRQWISPFGQNLYFSLLIGLKNGSTQLQGLSLSVGLAVLNTLKKAGLATVGLKWPNDLLVNNKKIAGILLEINGDPADICHVVIGIGINVNMLLNGQIDQAWTSLQQELNNLVDRTTLLLDLNNSLYQYLKIHFQKGFIALKEEWQNNNLWQDKMVTLLQGNQPIYGKMLGVDDTGALKLLINNEIQHFNAGEVSLRLATSPNNES